MPQFIGHNKIFLGSVVGVVNPPDQKLVNSTLFPLFCKEQNGNDNGQCQEAMSKQVMKIHAFVLDYEKLDFLWEHGAVYKVRRCH